jgi:hypothetical protein
MAENIVVVLVGPVVRDCLLQDLQTVYTAVGLPEGELEQRRQRRKPHAGALQQQFITNPICMHLDREPTVHRGSTWRKHPTGWPQNFA